MLGARVSMTRAVLAEKQLCGTLWQRRLLRANDANGVGGTGALFPASDHHDGVPRVDDRQLFAKVDASLDAVVHVFGPVLALGLVEHVR